MWTRGLSVVGVDQQQKTPVTKAGTEFYEATWVVTARPAAAPAEPASSPATKTDPERPSGAAPASSKKSESRPSSPSTRKRTAVVQQSSGNTDTAANDARLSADCSPALGRRLLREINEMKPIRNFDFSIVDLRSFRASLIG